MNYEKWLRENTSSLKDKTVAVTGSTGGIGFELCRYILKLGGRLIMIDRNPQKAADTEKKLITEFNNSEIIRFTADMENFDTVKSLCEKLKNISIDILILNAGAYSIPRKICATGYDNVFQINFISPYYLTKQLLPNISKNRGKVVVVGSIAHNYSKTDPNDTDFIKRKQSHLVYGNSKRNLMLSMYELFKTINEVSLSVTHPGITFTNITAHYPKWIFAIIKYPMKIIFMKPKTAALSVLCGIFNKTEYATWIGPTLFNIWGKPRKKKLKTYKADESIRIFNKAEEIYSILLI